MDDLKFTDLAAFVFQNCCEQEKAKEQVFSEVFPSSFSRKEVAFSECDVGQTEFTPPACIALNIVRQPLLGRF